MPIGRDEVRQIAALARLELSDPEIERLQRDLAQILEYVELLSELDTSAVEPSAYGRVERAPLRDDRVCPGVSHEQALAEAPRTAAGGFAVPAFVEE
jgi:aspartyl-tRNA(Asn)/glutamyl-tRNA(Gln) amidotransferase subunit C